jgi:E3 ubiquitin-protein ligase TRIP12
MNVGDILMQAEEAQRRAGKESTADEREMTENVVEFSTSPQKVSGKDALESPQQASYASAASSVTAKNSVLFSLGENCIPMDSTVFGACFNANTDHSNILSQTFIVEYKLVTEAEQKEALQPEAHPKEKKPKHSDFSFVIPNGVDIEFMEGKALMLLKIFHTLNSRFSDFYLSKNISLDHSAFQTIPKSTFLNNKVTAKFNRQMDEPLIVVSRVLPKWCDLVTQHFSFLIPFESKFLYLQSVLFGYSRSLNRWQGAQSQQSSSNREFSFLRRLPRQKIRIPRCRVLDMMIKIMHSYGSTQALLEIEYVDEVGTGLGPTLEFYASVCKEVRRKSGVFIPKEKRMVNIWRTQHSDQISPSEILTPKLGLFPCPLNRCNKEETR